VNQTPPIVPILLISLSLAACGEREGAGSPPDSRVIATVSGRPVTQESFDSYVAETMGGHEEAGSLDAEVKSRLLDQFLDEEVLVGAALEEGVSVSEEEVGRFLPGNAGNRQRLRRVLLQKKYKEQVILKNLNVSDEEILEHFRAHEATFRRPARAVLSKVLLDSAHEARNVRADLARDPDDFEEISQTRSLSPDGGRAQEYEEAALPDSLREVVASMREGELSEVVEDPMGFFILRLEERLPEQGVSIEEVRDQIELSLLREKGERRFNQSLADLRQGARIQIRKESLDFTYVSRSSS